MKRIYYHYLWLKLIFTICKTEASHEGYMRNRTHKISLTPPPPQEG
jgi:hypothetical protein